MHQENNKRNKLDLFVRCAFLILFIVLFVSLIGNVSRSFSAGSRIKDAQNELARLEAENNKLNNELEISTSTDFKEKEARDKLGLAKEGEIVLVLPPSDELRKLAPQRTILEVNLPDPNWKKWLKLFF